MRKTEIAIVVILAAAIAAVAWVSCDGPGSQVQAQVENRASNGNPGVIEAHAFIDLTSPASFCDDAVDSHGTGANGSCAFMIDLFELDGGSSPEVALRVQTSSDRDAWYDAIVFTPLTAPGLVSDLGQTQLMRYYRMCYATTGSPANATATYWEECAP